jgi:hypothetical protein
MMGLPSCASPVKGMASHSTLVKPIRDRGIWGEINRNDKPGNCFAWSRGFRSSNELAGRTNKFQMNHFKNDHLSRGTVKLANLRCIAEAMDCELVYSIVPKHTEVLTSTWVDAGGPVATDRKKGKGTRKARLSTLALSQATVVRGLIRNHTSRGRVLTQHH